jgi:hypothetical protein
MPHEVLAMIMKHLEETGATDDQGKAWDLVVKWCIVVAQKDAQGDSLVSFTVKAVTEGAYFDDVKTTLDFHGPNKPVFLQSYLIDILKNVWYATPVEQSNFPNKWK